MISRNSFVLLCTHNGEEYLKQQIDSIYRTNDNIKILVYDFDSQDKTIGICNEYAQTKNLNIYSFGFAFGAKESFFFALSHFKKTFHDNYDDYLLFFCDQDDIWMENKYFEVSKFHDNLDRSSPQFVHHNVKLINSDGIIINKSFYSYSKNVIEHRYSTLYFSVVIGHTVSMNKKFIQLINNFDGNDIIMHDWGLSIIADLNNCRYYIDDIFSYYRIHSNNVYGLNNSGFNIIKKVQRYFSNCILINKQRKILTYDYDHRNHFLAIFILLVLNGRLKLLLLLLGQKILNSYD